MSANRQLLLLEQTIGLDRVARSGARILDLSDGHGDRHLVLPAHEPAAARGRSRVPPRGLSCPGPQLAHGRPAPRPNQRVRRGDEPRLSRYNRWGGTYSGGRLYTFALLGTPIPRGGNVCGTGPLAPGRP